MSEDVSYPSFESHTARAPSEDGRRGALAALLRAAGAALLLASSATFLLQRWEHGNDVWRYALLLVQTVVVVAAAFVCGVRVRENRSARTFFALALATLPVHFGVLGGLVYSRLALDRTSAVLPKHVIWLAPSAAAALVTTAVALIVLVPMAFMALASLVRPEARRMLGLLLAMNALLLVPVRSPNLVALVLAAAALGLTWLEARAFRSSIALRTPEGRVVRAVLAAPLAIVAVRTIWLYSPGLLFGGVCLLTFGLAGFGLLAQEESAASRVVHAQRLAALLAVCGWLCVALELTSELNLPEALSIPAAGLPASLLLLALSSRAHDGAHYRRVALGSAVLTVAANLWVSQATLAALLAIVVGLLLVSVGVYEERRADTFVGAIVALSGVALQLHRALVVSKWLEWGSLSLLGVLLVFFAALIERNPAWLGRIARGWRARERSRRTVQSQNPRATRLSTRRT